MGSIKEPIVTEKVLVTLAVKSKQCETESDAQYFELLQMSNVAPLWTAMDKMVPPYPNPKAVSTFWDYKSMRPALLEAAERVTAEEAERRVLVLVNEAMAAPYTTDTIYAGLQIVLPNETAPAHRHRAFALRFIIEGSKGFTAVEGEKIEMERGDVILTPSWHWHNHGNDGKQPMIWLDGLDLPLWQFLPINFVEQYSEPRYPSTPSLSSALRFQWATVEQQLRVRSEPHTMYQYRSQDGSHLSKTISAQAERISAGHISPVSLEVLSYVYHVYEGVGYSTLRSKKDGTVRRVEWKTSDTFAVPSIMKCRIHVRWRTEMHTCLP